MHTQLSHLPGRLADSACSVLRKTVHHGIRQRRNLAALGSSGIRLVTQMRCSSLRALPNHPSEPEPGLPFARKILHIIFLEQYGV